MVVSQEVLERVVLLDDIRPFISKLSHPSTLLNLLHETAAAVGLPPSAQLAALRKASVLSARTGRAVGPIVPALARFTQPAVACCCWRCCW